MQSNSTDCLCAGLFYIMGLVLYAAGWGSPRVVKLCGRDAGPFTVGDCTFGKKSIILICHLTNFILFEPLYQSGSPFVGLLYYQVLNILLHNSQID